MKEKSGRVCAFMQTVIGKSHWTAIYKKRQRKSK